MGTPMGRWEVSEEEKRAVVIDGTGRESHVAVSQQRVWTNDGSTDHTHTGERGKPLPGSRSAGGSGGQAGTRGEDP
jgi:hypothetical protein